MKLSRIAEITGGLLIGDDADVRVEASLDSREVPEGGLFAALVGENVDGHRYVSSAFENGASAALVSEQVEERPLVIVNDVQAALGALAAVHVAEHRDHLTVIGVTGSMGKTTTKDLLAGILPGPTVATAKSLNNELGMPLTALRSDSGTRYLILEMGADRPGDLAYLTSLVAPDVAVVLAVGSAHLQNFGTQDAVAEAKAELVDGLADGGIAILNAADPRVAAMAERAERVLMFGRDVRAEDIQIDDLGRAAFDLVAPGGRAHVELGLIGPHHVFNALAAAAVASCVGVDTESVARSLSGRVAASPHRMNVAERADGVTVIDDSYNANPQSMNAALEVLARVGRGRRTIAVLGPMLELGEASESEHIAVGKRLTELEIDVVHLLGPIAAEMAPPGIETHVHETLDGIRAALNEQVRSGDVLLFKSSNGARLHVVAEEWAA